MEEFHIQHAMATKYYAKSVRYYFFLCFRIQNIQTKKNTHTTATNDNIYFVNMCR